jgi:DEAD/DEAH box helicase domain-containing protein
MAETRPTGPYATPTLQPSRLPFPELYKGTVRDGHAEAIDPGGASPMGLLVDYLERPEAEDFFRTQARAYSLALLDRGPKDPERLESFRRGFGEMADALGLTGVDFDLGEDHIGMWSPGRDPFHLTVYAGIKKAALLADPKGARPVVLARLSDSPEAPNDHYEAEWNGFWHYFNVLQFSDDFHAVSRTGLEEDGYLSLASGPEAPAAAAPAMDALKADWSEALALMADGEAKEVALAMMDRGKPAPVVGFELTNADGVVVAEAEMAWEDERLAYLAPGWETVDESNFLKAGWRVMTSLKDVAAEPPTAG